MMWRLRSMEPFENIQYLIAGWIPVNSLKINVDPLVNTDERHRKVLCIVSNIQI